MNKIHNNLTIENLVKTEWFNQFNENQKHRIIKGLNDNLDVSIYANPDFDDRQMDILRLGLKANIDVSIYAKKEYNWLQMDEIRKGLEANIDVSVYAKPEYNSKYMATIREGLEDNLDVVFYADYAFSDSQMEQIRKAIKEDKNLLITYGDGSHEFDQKQIEEIKYIAESKYSIKKKITKDSFLNKQKKRIVSFFKSLKKDKIC